MNPSLSPEAEERKLNIDIKEQEVHLENDLRCCSNTLLDKRCLKFAVQAVLSISIILLSSVQLIRNVSDSDKTLYYSMLSSTIAYWCPSPTIKEN